VSAPFSVLEINAVPWSVMCTGGEFDSPLARAHALPNVRTHAKRMLRAANLECGLRFNNNRDSYKSEMGWKRGHTRAQLSHPMRRRKGGECGIGRRACI